MFVENFNNNPQSDIPSISPSIPLQDELKRTDEVGRDVLSRHPSLQMHSRTSRIGLKSLINDFSEGNLKTLETILKRIEAYDKNDSIPEAISSQLIDIIDTQLDSLTECQILNWVHVINQYPSAITYKLINHIYLKLRSMPTHFPSLKTYYYHVKEDMVLKPTAFNYVTKQYTLSSEARIYPTTNFYMLPQKFIELLQQLELLQQFIDDPTLTKAAFPLVFQLEIHHYSLLYVEKTEGNALQFFLSDSLNLIEAALNDETDLEKSECDHVEIKNVYFLEDRRRNRFSGDVIFVLNDIFEIFKLDNFFDLLEQNQLSKNSKSIEMQNLPIEMNGLMKVTQSLNTLELFLNEKENVTFSASYIPGWIEHEHMDAQAFIDRFFWFDDDAPLEGKKNTYDEWSAAQLFEMILQKTQTHTDSQIPIVQPLDLECLLEEFSSGNLEVFETILESIESHSKVGPLPDRECVPLIETIEAHLHLLTESEILNWVHVINQHPSAITYELQRRIYLKLIEMPDHFPNLDTYLYKFGLNIGIKHVGFDAITSRYTLPDEARIYPATDFRAQDSFMVSPKFRASLQHFTESTLTKAVFPLTFGAHYDLLYVEKTEGNCLQFFASDSLGRVRFVWDIFDDLDFALEHDKIKDFYFLGGARQHSPNGCSVFTLNDIVEILKLDNFFDGLEQAPSHKLDEDEERCPKSIDIKHLPREMSGLMKVTQSLKDLDHFCQKREGVRVSASDVDGFARHEQMDFRTFIDQFAMYSESGKKQNKFPELCRAQLFEALLKLSLTSSQSEGAC